MTRAKSYRLLSRILGTAVESGYLASNPCTIRGAAAEPAPEMRFATVAEVAAPGRRYPTAVPGAGPGRRLHRLALGGDDRAAPQAPGPDRRRCASGSTQVMTGSSWNADANAWASRGTSASVALRTGDPLDTTGSQPN